MTVAEIAQIEGTDRRRVWASIQRGLKKLARLLDTEMCIRDRHYHYIRYGIALFSYFQ